MKKLFILLVIATLVVSCGKKPVEEKKTEKSDFLIQTTTVGDLTTSYNLEKSSRVEASDEVTLSSETMGRVSSISVKEGDTVSKGQHLVYILDTSLNLNNSYQQALLNLEQAKTSYQSNKINLDKAVFDSELQVEKLQNTLATTKETIEQNIRQAKDSLNNASIDVADSKSSLDMQKLENSIAKMELDYENQVAANTQQLNSFVVNLQKEKQNLSDLMKNVVEFGDDLYRISPDRDKAPYEVFLGMDNVVLRDSTENQIKEMMLFEPQFSQLKLEKIEDMNSFVLQMDSANMKVKSLIDNMKQVILNSGESIGRFSSAEKQAFLGKVDGYIGQYQGLNASYVANKNATNSFLNTYENSLSSLRKQIDLAEKDVEIAKKSIESGELSAEVNYDKLIISSKDTLTNLELQLKNAKNTLANAKQTRTVSLQNLNNGIKNAQLAVARASNEVSKLVVHAPISGIVANIMATEGQTYPAGTPFLKLLSNSKRELDVFLSTDDLEKISIGDFVDITYQGENYEGTVFSKSTLADANLNYRVKIELDKDINLVGGIADVRFKLQSKNVLIPLNAVSILESESDVKQGEVYVYQEGVLKKQIIQLGQVYGANIELQTELPTDTLIVLSDVSNYKEAEHILTTKKTEDIVPSNNEGEAEKIEEGELKGE